MQRRSASRPESSFDVAVLGAGPAGCAAALTLLVHSPFKVVLVDRDPGRWKPGEIVPADLLPLLEYVGASDSFLVAGHARGVGYASAWGSSELHQRSVIFSGSGDSWHLDRSVFERTLLDEVRARGGAFRHTAMRTAVPSESGWCIDLGQDTAPLSARFVIDATGRAARFARSRGARRRIGDRLVALFRTAELDPADDPLPGGSPMIEAVKSGWWYSARLPGKRLAIGYFSDRDLMGPRPDREALWRTVLDQAPHTRARQSRARQSGAPRLWAAGSQRLQPANGSDWIACGDSALAVDPLSSMGIGMALTTGIHAARVAAAACSGVPVADCGYSAEIVRQYELYLDRRRTYYAQEQRWPESPFWHRRHQS